MNTSLNQSNRTDDYLDLLNYAKQIGDLAWQKEIIAILTCTTEDTQGSRPLDDEINWLLSKFDSISEELQELLIRMEQPTTDTEQLRLSEKMWDLKLQQVNIHHQIRAFDVQN